MRKYAPTRRELQFRLVFSIAGLALLGVTVMLRGISSAAAFAEIVMIAGGFFGGTLLWSLRAMIRGDHSKPD